MATEMNDIEKGFALKDAIAKDDLPIVKDYMTALKLCPITQIPGSKYDAPIHVAARHGSMQSMRYFIQDLKADPKCDTIGRRNTTLEEAIIAGQTKMVGYLLKETTCRENFKPEEALYCAMQSVKVDIVAYLLEKFAITKAQIRNAHAHWKKNLYSTNYVPRQAECEKIANLLKQAYNAIAASEKMRKLQDIKEQEEANATRSLVPGYAAQQGRSVSQTHADANRDNVSSIVRQRNSAVPLL